MTDQERNTGQEIVDELERRDQVDEFEGDEGDEPPEPESPEAAIHWSDRLWHRSS